MRLNIEQIVDFATGVLIPGSLIWEEYKHHKQEETQNRLRQMKPSQEQHDYLTISTCDLSTYAAQVVSLYAAAHYDSDKLFWVTAGLATFRGLSKMYQGTVRRNLEEENNSMRRPIRNPDDSSSSIILD